MRRLTAAPCFDHFILFFISLLLHRKILQVFAR
jgi:hypothetical protein